jgi:hypothetical protein
MNAPEYKDFWFTLYYNLNLEPVLESASKIKFHAEFTIFQKISEFESAANKLPHCAAGTFAEHVTGLTLLQIPHHNIPSSPYHLFTKPHALTTPSQNHRRLK